MGRYKKTAVALIDCDFLSFMSEAKIEQLSLTDIL